MREFPSFSLYSEEVGLAVPSGPVSSAFSPVIEKVFSNILGVRGGAGAGLGIEPCIGLWVGF